MLSTSAWHGEAEGVPDLASSHLVVADQTWQNRKTGSASRQVLDPAPKPNARVKTILIRVVCIFPPHRVPFGMVMEMGQVSEHTVEGVE